MINRIIIFFVSLLFLQSHCFASDRIFRWLSEDGSMITNGGKIVQKNYSGINCINIRKGEEWTLMLIGKKENINEEGTENSTYLELTLNDGRTFRAGDLIQITGFRFTSKSNNASIALIFNNDTEITDNNVWPDIYSIPDNDETYSGTGNEPFTWGIATDFPEIYDFIVPQEADGATALRMTRDKAEAYLYISKIEIFAAEETTGVCVGKINRRREKTYTPQGILIHDNRDIRKGHIYINNGKKIMK